MFIRPACSFDASVQVHNFREGFVPGWGQSEDKSKFHETVPKEIKIPIVALDKCLIEVPRLAFIAAYTSFCGGSRNVEGVCKG